MLKKLVLEAITTSGALQYSRDKAEQASAKAINAIEGLPNSEFKDALTQLAHFSVDRNH